MRSLTLIMASAALAGCAAPSDAPQAAKGETAAAAPSAMVSQAEAQAAFDKVEADFATNDTAKVMANYAPDAVLFDAGRAKPSTDRNVQTGWTAQFMTMKPADFTTTDFAIQPLGPDSFVASGISAFTANVGPGRNVLHVRFSQLFKKDASGQWKIIHEHISGVPAEPGAPPA